MNKKVAMILGKDFKKDPRVKKEAFTLAENGYEVFVYEYNIINELEEELWKGVNIIRLPYNSRKSALIKHIKNLNPDIIVSHDLPVLPYGALLKFIIKSKLIYDSHEFYLHTFQFTSASLKMKIKRVLLAIAERMLIHYADVIITVNNYIMTELKNKYGLKNNIYVIMNTVSGEIDTRITKEVDNKYFNVVYHGGLNIGRGIEELCKSMKYADPDVRLYIYGDGPLLEDLVRLVNSDAIIRDKVKLMGFVQYERLLPVLSQFDLGAVCFRSICRNYYLVSPNKMFEYMSIGLPMIGSNLPFIKDTLLENEIGMVINSDDPEDIAEKINILKADHNLINKCKENLKKVYRTKFNWEIEGSKYLDIIQSLN